jgi:UDP-glucose 4-epimerase
MRVVVTGGAGFIGSHVTDELVTRGDEVHVVDDLSTGRRENVTDGAALHVHDIRQPVGVLFGELRPDAVVHLAAQADVRVSVARPDFDASVNVIGTVNVLEAARAVSAPVVFSSTGGAIYGECQRPAREDDPRLPLAPYGTAKLAGEEYLATFSRLYGFPNVSLRLGNVYGPRQDPHGEAGVVAIFLGRLREGQPCRIFGDGLQTRDYVHVRDVARAVLLALEYREPGVFNVGTGVETSVLELEALCRAIVGEGPEPLFEQARAGELLRSALDPGRATDELGFSAGTTLREGLSDTWDWARTA